MDAVTLRAAAEFLQSRAERERIQAERNHEYSPTCEMRAAALRYAAKVLEDESKIRHKP